MYDNSTKLCWRGWAWNQIQKRIRPGGLVVVLAGDKALDLDQSVKRGFECIGVDIDQDCVNTFRERGGVAIKDTLQRQLAALHPSGVIADQMGGLTGVGAGNLLVASMCGATGVVWNGMRGRDKGVGYAAEANKMFRVPEFSTGRARWIEAGLHRGRLAWQQYCMVAWLAVNKRASEALTGKLARIDITGFDEQFILLVSKKCKPEFFTYRSKDSGHYFDSVAFSPLRDEVGTRIELGYGTELNRKSRRKAAAAKAILTMRRQRN